MASISNRFFVSYMDDAETLHGNLISDISLSQSYNESSRSVVPDWSTTGTEGKKEQPTIFLTLLRGTTPVGQDSLTNVRWYYLGHGPGNELTFSSTATTITYTDAGGTTQSVVGYKSTGAYANMFLKLRDGYLNNGVRCPALRIIANLAGSDNLNVDDIFVIGELVTESGAPLDFSAATQVRIGSMTQGSYVGVISFEGGKATITEPGDSVRMHAYLYDGEGQAVPSFTATWYLNGVFGSTGSSYEVYEEEIVDYATVRCEFSVPGIDGCVATVYVGIDDMQDPEFMYVYVDQSSGNSAQLRTGERATFTVWVGRSDDPTIDTSWNSFKMQLFKSTGEFAPDNAYSDDTGYPGIPAVPSGETNHWRTLTRDSNGRGTFSIKAETVKQLGKNVSGNLIAYRSTN